MAKKRASPRPPAEQANWLTKVAPRIRQNGIGRTLYRWFGAGLAGAAHVELLTFIGGRTHNTSILYLTIAAPALIAAAFRPWESLNGWYRWPVLWVIWLTTAFGVAGLAVGDAVVLLTLFGPSRKELARPDRVRGISPMAVIYSLSKRASAVVSKTTRRPTAAPRQAGA